jgi:hypothetical protein
MDVTFEGKSSTGKNEWLTPPHILRRLGPILFIKGRLSFYHASGEQGGTAGAPSCLISFNKENTAVLERCGIEGKLVKL